MQLSQKLLGTIATNVECKNHTIAVEILRDIRDFYQEQNYTELESLLNQAVEQILLNYKGKI